MIENKYRPPSWAIIVMIVVLGVAWLSLWNTINHSVAVDREKVMKSAPVIASTAPNSYLRWVDQEYWIACWSDPRFTKEVACQYTSIRDTIVPTLAFSGYDRILYRIVDSMTTTVCYHRYSSERMTCLPIIPVAIPDTKPSAQSH